MFYSMMGGLLDGIIDPVVTFFKELFNFIPKIAYLLYASLASVLDLLQLFFRKIVGLDVYYVDGKAFKGDLVTNFIGGILGFDSQGFSYSSLSTVFYAFVVFGAIIIVVSTFVAIIKSHYNYDDKAKKGPMQYVYTALKSVVNIVAVPVIVFLGLYIAQALVVALDSITTVSNQNVASAFGTVTVTDPQTGETSVVNVADEYLISVETGQGKETYIYYDVFGFSRGVFYNSSKQVPVPSAENLALIGSANETFSGQLFKLAAFNANRARTGEFDVEYGTFTGGKGDLTSGLPIFQNASTQEELANLIDIAFANSLQLEESYELYYGSGAIDRIKYITGFNTTYFNSFSKYNVGLVWYYYDLWNFNWIVGFAACLICASLFLNIIMGLLSRLFMSIGLFLIYPPFFALAPMDGGKAGKSWTENFVKQVLMTFGSVVGMNLFFMILPYINNISFCNFDIADYFIQSLITIVGLVTVKAFIEMVQNVVGSGDLIKTGNETAKSVGEVAGKATKMSWGALTTAAKAPVAAFQIGKATVGAVQRGVHYSAQKKAEKQRAKLDNYQAKEDFISNYKDRDWGTINKKGVMADALAQGMSKKEAKDMWRALDQESRAHGRAGTIDNAGLENVRFNYAGTRTGQKSYDSMAVSYWDPTTHTYNQAYRNEYSLREGRVKYHDNRREAGKLKWNSGKKGFDGLLMPLKNTNTALNQNEGYKAFKENSWWQKEDYAKTTAQNTKAMLTEQRGTRQDIRDSAAGITGHMSQMEASKAQSRMDVLVDQFVAIHGRNPSAAERARLENDARAGNVGISDMDRRP